MLAIKTGEMAVVSMLIEAGADVNASERFRNQTPLMWAAAAFENAGEMVRMLLAEGADVTPRALYTDWPNQITAEPRAQYRPVGGLTALLYAARGGCQDCVDALIQAGADANRPTPEGVTALMLALDNDHNDGARLLLDHGADIELWDWWGRTALYIAVDRRACVLGNGGNCGSIRGRVESATDSNMEIIHALLAAGVDPAPQLNAHRPSRGGNSGRFIDPLMGTGATPLLRAAMAADAEVVRALLAAGANPNINAMGLTPFLVGGRSRPGPNRGNRPGRRVQRRRPGQYGAHGPAPSKWRQRERPGHGHADVFDAHLPRAVRKRRPDGPAHRGRGRRARSGSVPPGTRRRPGDCGCRRPHRDRPGESYSGAATGRSVRRRRDSRPPGGRSRRTIAKFTELPMIMRWAAWLLAFGLSAGPVLGQQGHPLSGSGHGE